MIAQQPVFSSGDPAPFLDVIKGRRSYYSLSDESPMPISDARIQELVEFTVKHTPSAYNVQAARAVVLFGDHHKRLWNDIVPKHMKAVLPEDKWEFFESKFKGHAAAYGTVLFFDDDTAVAALGPLNPMVVAGFPEWAAQSQGMHHVIAWAALEAEGLGANLQHVSMHPGVAKEMKEVWNVPDTWTPHAQLVFGKPTGDPMERTYKPLEDRVKAFA